MDELLTIDCGNIAITHALTGLCISSAPLVFYTSFAMASCILHGF